jgi:putative tryptophan/tyrosine transport system substrate-binding protein
MASHIGRRRFLATLIGGAAVALPLAVRAQQARKVRTIGYLSPSAPVFSTVATAFSNGLLELGWIEGQNIAI